MSEDAREAELRGLAGRYQVCWDSFPEWSQIDGERKQTGIVVELYGTHDRPDATPTAGCKHCIPVLQALLSIAEFAPGEGNSPLASIRAHSGIEYATERSGRPDIVVSLTMTPDEGRADAQAIASCLASVKTRLELLGACERTWRPPRIG
jgi:hypothetical protein